MCGKAYGIEVCDPMDKSFFCTLFINEFKGLYVGHSSERDECAEDYAEEYGDCGKDKGIFKTFENEDLPIFPYKHNYVFKTEHLLSSGIVLLIKGKAGRKFSALPILTDNGFKINRRYCLRRHKRCLQRFLHRQVQELLRTIHRSNLLHKLLQEVR